MKKQFTIFLILIFVLGLAPINSSEAITQNQINAEVQIVCPDDYGNWYSGSGTLIDEKGIILTNKHVVTDEHGGIIKNCFVGLVESISQEPDFGTRSNPNLAEVKYYTATDDMDAAVLYMENTTGKTYPYVNIWGSDSSTLQLGDKIEVVGYPSIGGSTITYTSGDFSGFGSSSNKTDNYLKTTAALEHGNSGGAAYNASGQFIGIPTMVIIGKINSINYILSVNSIKEWLSSLLGINYQGIITEQESTIEKRDIVIQNDITPPVFSKGIGIKYYFDYSSGGDEIQYYWNSNQIIDASGIKKYYYYYGTSLSANPVLEGHSFIAPSTATINIPVKFPVKDLQEKYLILQIEDNNGNISSPTPITYHSVQDMISQREFIDIYETAKNKYTYKDDNIVNKYAGKFLKEINNDNIIWYVNPKDNKRHLIIGKFDNKEFWYSNLGTLVWNGGSTGITTLDLKNKPQHVWGHLLIEVADDGSGIVDQYYIAPATGTLYKLPLTSHSDYDINTIIALIDDLSSGIGESEINRIPLSDKPYLFFEYDIEDNQIPKYTTQYIVIPDYNLMNKLKGKLLLQVEQGGRIWYVNPEDGKRHEVTFANALPLFENLALGVSDEDLNKIPLSDDTWASATGNRLKGKLLLQVEQGGRIWYVDFEGRRWEVTWVNLMDLFRNLALGITDEDLSKIPS